MTEKTSLYYIFSLEEMSAVKKRREMIQIMSIYGYKPSTSRKMITPIPLLTRGITKENTFKGFMIEFHTLKLRHMDPKKLQLKVFGRIGNN